LLDWYKNNYDNKIKFSEKLYAWVLLEEISKLN
jgi:hypothetical protein